MLKLKTVYKIRAEISAHVVKNSGLLSKAREIGLNLKADDAGTVEGAWDASLLTLAAVLQTLQEAGAENPLIQRRVVSLTVAAEPSKREELEETLRRFGVSQSEDVFTAESVLRFNVPCEEAEEVLKTIGERGISKVIATEAFEIVATPPPV